ncbi:MAG TPA: tyrosine-type recombinase/integrase [Vicinamibacterales bacterium]|nr:tyrosine-type recombinase/integrase [Vicinamibacterales bacterium]
MNVRGMGRIFQPSYKDKTTGALKKSAKWWIEFYINGKPHRESSKSTKESDAKKLLKTRVGEAGIGKLLPSEVAKTTFEDLKKLISDDYAKNERDSADQLKIVLKRLDVAFAGMTATEITAGHISAYQAAQKKEGYANATINRDMAALKRMFRLGHRIGVVATVPHIEMLQEQNVRKGFFEPAEFKTLLMHLADELKPLFRVAYITGWRVKSELLTRGWHHVDFVHKKLRIEPGEDKNKSGREFPFTADLERILREQRRRADDVQRKRDIVVRSVFFREDGTPIRSYRHGWKEAVDISGVQRIPHDFRRTAVRNLEIAGVPRAAAMKMVGHKTESIYRRYAIVDEAMMQDAAERLSALHKQHARVKPTRKLVRMS